MLDFVLCEAPTLTAQAWRRQNGSDAQAGSWARRAQGHGGGLCAADDRAEGGARQCRTFATTTEGLLALLAWLTESRCTHVAMEATGVYWMPVWKILSDGEFELIVERCDVDR